MMEVWVYAKLRERNLTQKQLAAMLGISSGTLCKKFGGKLPFLYDEVIRICDIFGIDNPRDYFSGKAKK